MAKKKKAEPKPRLSPENSGEGPEDDGTDHPMKAGGMVAMMASIMAPAEPGKEASIEEQNIWKKRMLLASSPKAPDGTPLLSFPDDFDTLPEKEKAKRLDMVIEHSQASI